MASALRTSAWTHSKDNTADTITEEMGPVASIIQVFPVSPKPQPIRFEIGIDRWIQLHTATKSLLLETTLCSEGEFIIAESFVSGFSIYVKYCWWRAGGLISENCIKSVAVVHNLESHIDVSFEE